MKAVPLTVRIAVALFGLMTSVLPRRFRASFGPDLREGFADEALDEYRRRGRLALLGVTLRGLADLFSSSWQARVETGPRPQASPRRSTLMTSILQDLRYAFRTFRKQPGFALVALLTLSVGIGANTAIFTVLDAALLRPLPYPGSDRLVRVWGTNANNRRANLNPLDATDWAREVRAFESLAVWTTRTQPLTGEGDPIVVPVAFVTPVFFETLRARTAIGRLFGDEHARPGRETEIVISHGLWHDALGRDPSVLGRTVRLADVACTIIGVLDPSFISPGISASSEPQIWRPFVIEPDSSRGGHFAMAIARLAGGASIVDAQAQIDAVTARLAREYPSTNLDHGAFIEPLRESITGSARTAILMLMAAVGVVLLIACVNVANLLLARATVRQREVAVRSALGATRGRVIRQMLTESLVLALLGGIAGVGLGVAALIALPAWLTGQIPLVMATDIDARVLAFTLLLSMTTALVFGLLPALQGSRWDVRTILAAGGDARSTGSGRAQQVFLIVETALALVLLVTATLLVRSLIRLQSVDPGFDADRVLTFRVSLPRARYPATAQRIAFFTGLADRLRALPGVTAAGAVNMPPLTDRYSCDSFGLADRPAPPAGEEPCTEARVATRGYFAALGIPLLAGRAFTAGDTADAPGVIVINDAMAQKYWPDGNALGQRFKWGCVSCGTPWLTVIGIVGNVKHFGLDAEAAGEVYTPLEQSGPLTLTMAVRTVRDPGSLASEVRGAVGALDPALPIFEVFTTRQLVAQSTAVPAFRTEVLTTFAVVALGLAVIGVYGVMAFFVAQRSHEIGVRLALGASPADVRSLVVRRGMTAAAAGALLGIAASVPVTQLIGGLLFGVTPHDPVAYGVAPLLLLATALLASYLPASRATRVDPLAALRAE
ncbi:MAG TPA: ABC transporter permease [Vicinamibacterales bacterium]|nr:ABC transporter permease [Vicinamibacterales bacterium]